MNHVHSTKSTRSAHSIGIKHLNAPVRPGYAPTADGNSPADPIALAGAQSRRHVPHAACRVEFGDVSMMWYANQGERPLAGSRGQLQDHTR
jgi:hypothetical protein